MTVGREETNIVVAGASGFVGSALVKCLEKAGYPVFRLVRRPTKTPNEIEWHPNKRILDASALPESPICINLSGDSIADGRWTEEKKKSIVESRINTTETLVTALRSLPAPPRQFISASAIGIYGDRGEDLLTEQSSPGSGFLAETCMQWEAAARQLSDMAVPIAFTRFGIILDPEGGALAKMLPPFKLGIAGRIGSGKQWMSWITLEDTVRAIMHIIEQSGSGAYNITAPEPVRNSTFTRALGDALHRPTILPLPAFAARLALGEFADEALLASTQATPAALLEEGFAFSHPKIDQAFESFQL